VVVKVERVPAAEGESAETNENERRLARRDRERGLGRELIAQQRLRPSLNLIVEVWGEKVWGEMINAAQQPSTMRSHSVGCRIHEPNIDRFLRKLKRIG
jgi:hypothetical protein